MRFLVDAQLPPALARCLAARGHEATHVADHGMVGASDEVIWDHALSIEAVILTKDEDFAARKFRSNSGPPVVWLRLPNMKRKQLIGRFEMLLPSVVAALERGETLVETV